MAAPVSYKEIADTYSAEREKYRRLAVRIATAIESDLVAARVEAIVHNRPKEIPSFVKKALRGGYKDPMAEIEDKAGVRVIVHYLADVPVVKSIVTRHCEVHSEESKLDALDFDKLGYLGTHLIVSGREDLLGDEADLEDLRAEIQVHTKAQNAWAVVSHDQLYKSPLDIPSELKRTIYRLVALVELFDNEVASFVREVREHPDYEEMKVLEPLDDLLVKFTPRRPDHALSALVVPALVQLHGVPPAEVFDKVIAPFVDEHREALETIYEQYADDDRANPLLFQPEAFLIFAALATDPDRLIGAWPEDRLPRDLLDEMAVVWGVDLEA